MLCCGPREKAKPADRSGEEELPNTTRPSEPGSARSSSSNLQPRSGLRLLGKVERGDGLILMDTVINAREMGLETTLDAYVRMTINDEPCFGKTEVHWKSKGDPRWDHPFSVDIAHPRSFLCLFVCDDDPVFQQDRLLAHQRDCGFLEIPLWELPLNRTVRGWFTLKHPSLAQSSAGLADRLKEQDAVDELNEQDLESAGRLRLSLTLQGTALQELIRYTQPAPVFTESPPSLDVPGFLEDVFEVKRLIMDRLVFALVRSVTYALSWQSPALSTAVLLWHWFLCYHPQYTWASIWFGILLCFWHEIPPQDEETAAAMPETKDAGTPSNSTSSELRQRKPWMRKLTREVVTGLVNVKDVVVTTAGEITGEIRRGIGSLRGPGLQEFQQILRVRPALKDTVRRLHGTLANILKQLALIEGLFYWASAGTTAKVVFTVMVAFVLSIIFSSHMRLVSGYAYLILGTVVITANSKWMILVRAIVAVWSKPKHAFQSRPWFEPL